jgi:hypothetical protein
MTPGFYINYGSYPLAFLGLDDRAIMEETIELDYIFQFLLIVEFPIIFLSTSLGNRDSQAAFTWQLGTIFILSLAISTVFTQQVDPMSFY